MNTSKLLNYLELENSLIPNIEISGGQIDSRKIREGEIFLHIREIMLMVINLLMKLLKMALQ